MAEETKCYCGHTTYCDCGPEQPEKIVNPYADSFLERNSFKNVCPNKWANDKCLITILEDCYMIQFTNFDGDWEMNTDSYSLPHLVGVLTWHDLLDRNYAK